MKYFLSFLGYPRSGHTLVAAILNANPNVYCSNQLNLLADIENKPVDLNFIKSYSENKGTWKSTTQIPHVPKQEINVIGDKTGHRNTLNIAENPQKLIILKQQVNVPIKWIHVVRNPFDNLSTWSRLNYETRIRNNSLNPDQRKELDIVINEYDLLNQTIEKLKRSEDILTVRHEYVITRMHNTLEEMANFLEISFDPLWRDNVRNSVWKKPRITRKKIQWTQQQKKAVHDIIDRFKWLKGYDFGPSCGRC